MHSKGGTLLTLTEEIIRQWKEHFEELLKLTKPSSTIKAELEDDGGSTFVFLEEVITTRLNNSTVPKPQGLMRSIRKC